MIPLSTIWDQLSVAFNEIFNGQRIAPERFIAFYTLIYDYCTKSHEGPRHIHLEYTGGRLYTRIKNYLMGKIGKVYQKTKAKHGNELVDFYLMRWKDYSLAFRRIDGMAMYLNKHWVRGRMETKPETVHYILELCLSIWRTKVFDKISDELLGELVKMLLLELEGDLANLEIPRMLIDAIVELHLTRIDLGGGVSAQMEKDVRLDYANKIQNAYIERSENRYCQIDDQMLVSTDFPEYLEQVNNFLDKEIHRFNRHFGIEAQPSLVAMLSKVFVERHLDLYKAKYLPLLEQGTNEDICTLYQVCVRCRAVMVIIKEIEYKYIEALANKYTKEPRTLIEEIMTGPAFKFIEAHNKVFTSYIKYPVPRIVGEVSSKLAVITARHCDYLLKRSKIVDHELDAQLQTTLAVVNYIDDKDVFQRTYAKLLAKRLLDSNLFAESSEKMLVVQLRDLCGLEYASGLQKMLTDIELSRDLSDAFKQKCRSDGVRLEINFSASILASTNWQMTSSIQLQIPIVLQETVTQFMVFYAERHLNRKLIWIHSHSQGELLTNCFKKSYLLQACTPQLAILMLFNEVEEANITLQMMIDQLGVKKEEVLPILGSLLKVRIIKSDLANNTEVDISIPETTEFSLNFNFTHKRTKIDLTNIQIPSETKKDQELIEKDRRKQIEACVIRIMKMRKRLAHNELIAEVISQLSTRFTPNMPKIRIAIEDLIERLFLKRDDQSMNIYEYNA